MKGGMIIPVITIIDIIINNSCNCRRSSFNTYPLKGSRFHLQISVNIMKLCKDEQFITMTTNMKSYSSSDESQKGAITIQRCSVENQKGARSPLTLYSDSALLVLNGTSLNIDSALLALNWRVVGCKIFK